MKKKDVFFVIWIIMFSPVVLTGVVLKNVRLAYLFGYNLAMEILKGF
ncbi:hypothetical protein LCGC14_2240300 [marine sediment metagenome]|uniref:Uncharacterized protein n=1 Tax=marine sediment metagenome TaxID=412755 RepID=A0A0F9D5V2_9ZZZZ